MYFSYTGTEKSIEFQYPIPHYVYVYIYKLYIMIITLSTANCNIHTDHIRSCIVAVFGCAPKIMILMCIYKYNTRPPGKIIRTREHFRHDSSRVLSLDRFIGEGDGKDVEKKILRA